MQAKELAELHEMRGESFMAEYFRDVRIDNKSAAQNDPYTECPDTFLFPRVATVHSLRNRSPSIPGV